MIFSEAFHPEWELELTRDNETYKINEHYLGNLYGNAWWIDKTGEYNFTIEFKPQQKVELGGYLGASGLLILILLVLRPKLKKFFLFLSLAALLLMVFIYLIGEIIIANIIGSFGFALLIVVISFYIPQIIKAGYV